MAFTTYDNAPYLYRRSGGGGDKEIDKLVGGTIAWNQIVRNGNFADTSDWTVSSGSSFTVSNNVATFRADAGYRSLTQFTLIRERVPKLNHIYMGIIKAKSYTNTNTFFYVRTLASVVLQTASKTLTTTEKEYVNVLKVTQEATYFQFMVQDNNASGYGDITIQNARFFDLTLMFGSTIADYVYSLEQSSQGSGLAWLQSYGFFTEDYYDYNSGELKSVSNLVSHDMTGKNLLPMTLANMKTINTAGSWSGNSYNLLGITYTVNVDSGGNVESITTNGTATSYSLFRLYNEITFTVETTLSGCPSGGSYGGYRLQSEGGATRQDIGNGVNIPSNEAKTRTIIAIPQNTSVSNLVFKPMIRLASVTDDTYEPYTLRSYPLGDVTLRGLPKLNGNALYYDGDTYESNGTVTRKYGVVDSGSLTWTYDSSAKWIVSSPLPNSVVASDAGIPNAIANVDSTVVNRLYLSPADKGWTIYNGRLYKKDISLSEADLRATITGKTLVYELATPTTETADAYTNPQWVDPNGTERYTLSSNAFPMPVGHETTYNTDMGSKTVNTQVNLSMTEPSVRQVYAKEGDTARVLNIHLDQTEEDGTLRILRPDGTEVTAEAVLVPEFYDGLMAEIPSDATSVVGKCYCDVEQNGVSSMPFTLNVKKNERAT